LTSSERNFIPFYSFFENNSYNRTTALVSDVLIKNQKDFHKRDEKGEGWTEIKHEWYKGIQRVVY